ncbi:MAG: DoxX family protein [Candidatus Omnitrophica bacterium]|nr:DoxX family protein [Candidatus Omnitrophota bacterium]MDD5487613.1 DoxX family protein [Candidatus Omnitrophota bacterium]
MRERIPYLILRISLGVVFLVFGIGKFQDDHWARTIRTMEPFISMPWDVSVSVLVIGFMELITGAALILGTLTRLFAVLAGLQLVAILILLGFQETRDIGLLGAAFYLAFGPAGGEKGERTKENRSGIRL